MDIQIILVIFLFVLAMGILIAAIALIRKPVKSKIHKCKVCSKEVAVNAPSCPHCGARLKMHPVIGCMLWLLIFILLIVTLFLGSSYYFWNEMKSPNNKAIQNNSTSTLTVPEFINKMGKFEDTMTLNADKFIETEHAYLSRNINQQQAITLFKTHLENYELALKEVENLSIPRNSPSKRAWDEFLMQAKDYHRHMTTKYKWTVDGVERGTVRAQSLKEQLRTYNAYKLELVDLSNNK